MRKYDYDLIVIGAGIGGLASATFAAGLGRKVLLVEEDRIGGSCTLRTCMPTKSLIRSGVVANILQRASDYGIVYNLTDYNADGVFPYINKVVNDVNGIDTPNSFNQIGINTAKGAAKFIDRHTIVIKENRYSSQNFIIATGSIPAKLGIDGEENKVCLDIEALFRLNNLPRSIVVIGGGAAGVELGLAMRLLGLEVTILEVADTILFHEDSEIVSYLTEYLQQLNIKIYSGCKISKITENKGGAVVTVKNSNTDPWTINSDAVLMTVGRKPKADGLALEKAGVSYSTKGILVNNQMRTSKSNIFACGDVTGKAHNASMVEKQALIAANNAVVPFLKKSIKLDNGISVIFTEPPLARIGLTEDDAYRKYGDQIRVYKYNFRDLRRAKMERQDFGIAKIICKKNGSIIGAHILGERAEELIHELQLLVATGKPLHFLHQVGHAYPTFSEGILKRLGDMAYIDKMRNNIMVRIGLKILPGFRDNLESIKTKL